MRRGPLDNVDVWAVKRTADESGLEAAKDNVAAQLRADAKHEEAQLEAERQELGVESSEGLVVLVEAPPSPEQPREGPRAAAAKRARRDAPAALRVARLRAAGHWSDDLPAAQAEPAPPKTHWSYLLDEAVWLAREVPSQLLSFSCAHARRCTASARGSKRRRARRRRRRARAWRRWSRSRFAPLSRFAFPGVTCLCRAGGAERCWERC